MFPNSLKKPEIVAAICGCTGFLGLLIAANVKAIDNMLPPVVFGAGTAVATGTILVTAGAFAGAKLQQENDENALHLDDSEPVPQPPQIPTPNFTPVGKPQILHLDGGSQLYFQQVSAQPAPVEEPAIEAQPIADQRDEVDYEAFQQMMSEVPTVLDPWEDPDELPPLNLGGYDISYRGRN